MHDEAAGYVLDALDADEARAFERHLTHCPDCEDELEPLRIAVAALAFAGELPQPPAALRRRVVVPRLRRRRAAPLASAAVLAACAAIAVALTGNSHTRHVSFQLPPAPPGKVYEIWFMRHGLPIRAGFAHGGRNDVRHVPRGAAVAVTIEPGGGSRRPTGPVILRTETA